MATKKEPAAQAVENAVETVEKIEAKDEEKDDGMVTIHLFKDDDRYSAPVFVGVNGDSYLIQRGIDVKVPKAVAEVLEHSIKQDAEAARKSQAMQANPDDDHLIFPPVQLAGACCAGGFCLGGFL